MIDGIVTVENVDYLKSVMRLNKGGIDQLRNELTDHKANHADLSNRLATSYDRIVTLERKLTALLNGQVNDPTGDLEQISKLERIESFKIDQINGKISFDVKPCFIVDPRRCDGTPKSHRIGKTRVKLDLISRAVFFYSLEYSVYSVGGAFWNIPHADSSGVPCWGNGRAQIDKCFADMKFYNLVITCIVFIDSVNTADEAGRALGRWPYKNGDKIEYCTEFVKFTDDFIKTAEFKDTFVGRERQGYYYISVRE